MAEKIIQNPSITTNVFEYDGAGRVSAISGHPLAGEGGGEVVKSDFVWLPSVTNEGVISWQRSTSATAPSTANIMGPQGNIYNKGPNIDIYQVDDQWYISAAVPDEEFIDDKIESLSETIKHILDLSTLDEENSTFDVVLTANRNNAISFVGSSEETAIVAIEIENDKPCHIQIFGACTLAITGVSWIGDEITAITTNAEISILNNIAVGVLYE